MRYLTYLESDGTQYIDTGLIADSSTNLYVEYYDFGNENSVILGARGSSATDRAYEVLSQSILYLDYGSVRTVLYGSARPAIGQNRVVEFRGGIIYVDGVQVAAPGGTFTTPYSQVLFAQQSDNGIACSVKTRIYRVTYSKNGSTIRDFRPALDNDGIACMYDTVSGQFFRNAGTGNFIYLDPGPGPEPTIQDKLAYATLLALTTQNVTGYSGGSSSVFFPAFKYSVQQNMNSPSIVLDRGGRSYLTKAGGWGAYYCFGTQIPKTARRVTLHLSATDAGSQYHRNIRVYYRADYAATDGGEWHEGDPAIPLAWILSNYMTVEQLMNQLHILSLHLTSDVNLEEQDVVIDVSHVSIDSYLVVTQANVVSRLYSISYE